MKFFYSSFYGVYVKGGNVYMRTIKKLLFLLVGGGVMSSCAYNEIGGQQQFTTSSLPGQKVSSADNQNSGHHSPSYFHEWFEDEKITSEQNTLKLNSFGNHVIYDNLDYEYNRFNDYLGDSNPHRYPADDVNPIRREDWIGLEVYYAQRDSSYLQKGYIYPETAFIPPTYYQELMKQKASEDEARTCCPEKETTTKSKKGKVLYGESCSKMNKSL